MQFEFEIIKWFQDISNDFFDVLAEGITFFGEQYIMIVIIAFIYFVYNKRLGEAIAYSVFLSLNLNNAIKGMVKAKRPFQLDEAIVPKRAHTATGFSFPSGHTQGATVLYTSIGMKLKHKKLWIVIIVGILLVALSRVYLGVHFPHDVVAGLLLGFACAILGTYLYDKFATNLKNKLMMLLITALLYIPFAFIFYQPSFTDIEVYRDFYTGLALFLGFIAAIYIENKYVNFDCKSPMKVKLIRYFIALLIFVVTQMGLKIIFPNDNIFFDILRYFLVTFVPMGLYPLTFKKLNLM